VVGVCSERAGIFDEVEVEGDGSLLRAAAAACRSRRAFFCSSLRAFFLEICLTPSGTCAGTSSTAGAGNGTASRGIIGPSDGWALDRMVPLVIEAGAEAFDLVELL
jgi:hypothetical protein